MDTLPRVEDVHVTETDVERVVDLAMRDENPLGIDVGDPFGVNEMNAEDVLKRALLGLTDEQRPAVARGLDRLVAQRADPTCDIDRVFAELLAHRGIDPLALAWLSAACGGTSVHDDGDLSEVASTDATLRPWESTMCDTVIALGEAVWWGAGGRLKVGGLPDAAVTAAVGRPLREVLSHPVLDRFDMLVAEATAEFSDPVTGAFPAELTCHFAQPPVGSDELAAISKAMAEAREDVAQQV